MTRDEFAATNEFTSAHDWLFDVLSDLRNYARMNELPALSTQLENALLVCAVELESAIPDESAKKLAIA